MVQLAVPITSRLRKLLEGEIFSGPAKLLESIIWSYRGLLCQTPTDCRLSACQKGVTLAALGKWGSVSATHTTNCLDMARAFGGGEQYKSHT